MSEFIRIGPCFVRGKQIKNRMVEEKVMFIDFIHDGDEMRWNLAHGLSYPDHLSKYDIAIFELGSEHCANLDVDMGACVVYYTSTGRMRIEDQKKIDDIINI